MFQWSHYVIYQLLLDAAIKLEFVHGWEDPEVQSHYWMLVDCPIAAEA